MSRKVLCLAALLPAGCGVLAVPEEATTAVEAWRDRVGEVDLCRFDAMQHCVGGSAAAAACGRPCAILLGQLLEIAQCDGNAMDLQNNAAGAECARPIADSVDDAVSCCEALLNAEPAGLVTSGPCQ